MQKKKKKSNLYHLQLPRATSLIAPMLGLNYRKSCNNAMVRTTAKHHQCDVYSIAD